MTAVAILEPQTLLGKEVRGSLERLSRAPGEVRLLTRDTDATGTVSEVGGAAALVGVREEGCLEGIDVVLACGEPGEEEVFVPEIPDGATLILVGAASPTERAGPLVAGVGEIPALAGGVWASPHPIVVLLAHLLAPLRDLGLVEASAHVTLPGSLHGGEGMDEIAAQVRTILSFSGKRPEEVYGAQIAFNLLPSKLPVEALLDQLGRVLGPGAGDETPRVTLRLIQAGVFHCLAAELQFRLSRGVESSRVMEALEAHAHIAVADEADLLGPIDAAGRDEILVGRVDAADGTGELWWLTAVMDNLTRGGALNALALADSLL